MKRRMKKDRAKSMPMDGKSNEPFMKKAKKPENDDKPHVRVGAPSVNKNSRKAHSERVKRLTGVRL